MSDFIDWEGFTPAFAAAELSRLLEASEASVKDVESAEGTGYEEFAWALDDATRDLLRTWKLVSHMLAS